MAGISFSYADSDHFRFLRRTMKKKNMEFVALSSFTKSARVECEL